MDISQQGYSGLESEVIMKNSLLNKYDINKLAILDDINIKYGQAKISNYIKAILSRIFFREVYLLCDNDISGIVFLKSESSRRIDHAKSFSNVYKTAGKNTGLIIVNSKNKISVRRIIKKIKLFINNFKLFNSSNQFIECLARVNLLLIMDDFIRAINKIDISRISLGVVYYDVSVYDYLFVQYLKEHGIKTATLQHAAFIAPRRVSKPNFEFEGIELVNSTADLYLAWNPFTKDEAIKCGIKEEGIRILGIPKYAEHPNGNKYRVKNNKKVFGVVLNAKSFGELNKELVKFANYVAREFGYGFYLKYHPQFKEFEYDELADINYFKGHLPIESTIDEYIDMVDFTILNNSSVFIEFIYLQHQVLRYQAGEYDKFKDVPFCTFENEKALHSLISNMTTEKNNELFRYLCYTSNPAKEYAIFFEKMK